jgi:hypothetical protein
MEIRINESRKIRRQKLMAKLKNKKTHYADTIKNDVAVNEDLVPMVHPPYADVYVLLPSIIAPVTVVAYLPWLGATPYELNVFLWYLFCSFLAGISSTAYSV